MTTTLPSGVAKNVDVSFHNVNRNNNLTGQNAKIANHPLHFYIGGFTQIISEDIQ